MLPSANFFRSISKGVLGTNNANQKSSTSKEVQELSSKQMKLRDEAESSQNKQWGKKLKKERNKVLSKIRNQLKFEKVPEMDEELKEIQACKDDPSKYYQAIRKVNSKKPKKPLKIYDDSFNLITSEEDQISKITEFIYYLTTYSHLMRHKYQLHQKKWKTHSHQRRSRKHQRSLKTTNNSF